MLNLPFCLPAHTLYYTQFVGSNLYGRFKISAAQLQAGIRLTIIGHRRILDCVAA